MVKLERCFRSIRENMIWILVLSVGFCSFKHANSGKLNIYSEDTLVYLSLMLLVLRMQWLVMIWVKVLLTKKWWRRSVKFLWIQLWFRLQMNRYKLWFIALTKHDYNNGYPDTYPIIASYSPTGHNFHLESFVLVILQCLQLILDTIY